MERSLADRLHSLAIHLLRWARSEDAAAGVSAARLSVLAVLVFGRRRTVTELAAAEQVSVPTMTRLLQGLEVDGCVRRRRAKRDARVVHVTATARGRRVLESARRARLRRMEQVLTQLHDAESADVARAVAALEAALAKTVAGD